MEFFLFLRVLAWLAMAYVGLLFLVYLFQEKLLFFPDRQRFDSCQPMEELGAKPIQLDWEGVPLRYYLREEPDSKVWLIHFHGNANSACERACFISNLKSLKVNFVMAEYPGYSGDLFHRTTERSILGHAQALLDHLRDKNSGASFFLYGESLGSGVVTYLASQQKNSVSGLILQSPYTSLEEVGSIHYRFIPVKKLLRHKFLAHEWAKEVTAPVIAFHGTKDRTIPYLIGKKQSENFKNLKRFITITGAEHNNVTDVDSRRYWSEVKKFIKDLSS